MTLLRPSERVRATAAILAGGRAARMSGAVKSLLRVGEATILDRQLRVLRPRFEAIVVGAGAATDVRPFVERGLAIVTDRFDGSGPMAGLHAALDACRTPWLFACACDMPFLDGAAIDAMLALAGEDPALEALVPRTGGRPDPLHALYRAALAARAAACLAEGRRAMTDLLDRSAARFLDEGELPGIARSLANLNTPEEVAAASRREV